MLSTQWFQLITDHQDLQYAFKKIDVHGRVTRWLEFLSDYDFTIRYKPGASSRATDFLSRFSRRKPASDHGDEGELDVVVSNVCMDLEPFLNGVTCFLTNGRMKTIEMDPRSVGQKAVKRYLVFNGRFFCRTRLGAKLS